MESRVHRYEVRTVWTGNTGQGTSDYRAYKRDHEISGPDKLNYIPGSSDPIFRGDRARYSPEELLVGALAACHMLWILHLCADRGIRVTSYSDLSSGQMAENPEGSGRFTEVTLRPLMTIDDAARIAEVEALHAKAHELCFIANSVNFPVHCSPAVVAEG